MYAPIICTQYVVKYYVGKYVCSALWTRFLRDVEPTRFEKIKQEKEKKKHNPDSGLAGLPTPCHKA